MNNDVQIDQIRVIMEIYRHDIDLCKLTTVFKHFNMSSNIYELSVSDFGSGTIFCSFSNWPRWSTADVGRSPHLRVMCRDLVQHWPQNSLLLISGDKYWPHHISQPVCWLDLVGWMHLLHTHSDNSNIMLFCYFFSSVFLHCLYCVSSCSLFITHY